MQRILGKNAYILALLLTVSRLCGSDDEQAQRFANMPLHNIIVAKAAYRDVLNNGYTPLKKKYQSLKVLFEDEKQSGLQLKSENSLLEERLRGTFNDLDEARTALREKEERLSAQELEFQAMLRNKEDEISTDREESSTLRVSLAQEQEKRLILQEEVELLRKVDIDRAQEVKKHLDENVLLKSSLDQEMAKCVKLQSERAEMAKKYEATRKKMESYKFIAEKLQADYIRLRGIFQKSDLQRELKPPLSEDALDRIAVKKNDLLKEIPIKMTESVIIKPDRDGEKRKKSFSLSDLDDYEIIDEVSE